MQSHLLLFVSILSSFLLTTIKCENVLVIGRVVCPNGRAPDEAEVTLWDLDGPDSDDKGGTAITDAGGNFKLAGRISDWFGRPEPYLKVSGDCDGKVVMDQVYGLACNAGSKGERSDGKAYANIKVVLNGKDIPPPSQC